MADLRAAANRVFLFVKRGHVLGPETSDHPGTARLSNVGGSATAWVVLFAAGLLEVGWTVAMRQSRGFTRLVPSPVILAGMAGSVVFLAPAMRSLPLGTAYTVRTGIGAVGAFVVGIASRGAGKRDAAHDCGDNR